MFGYRLIIIDKALFVRKLFMLLAFSAGLVPLLMNKNRVGIALYVTVLLLLHAYVLVVYLWRVSWREFLRSKRQFMVRLSAILFFSYLLSKLRFDEHISSVIVLLCISVFLHIMILLLLMVKMEPALSYEPASDAPDDEN